MPILRLKPAIKNGIKRRKRGFPLIRLMGGMFLFLAVGKFFFGNSSRNNSAIQQASVVPDFDISKIQTPKLLQQVMESEQKSKEHVVKTGDSFFGILSQFDLKNVETSLIIQAFKHLDAITLFPGDSIILRGNHDGSFSSIDFIRRPFEKYTVFNRDSAIVAQKELLPITDYTFVLKGCLETSLSEAMFNLGVGDIITANIADIFAWDINFFIDPRKGDTFEVLFDRQVINGKFCGYGDVIAAKYTLNNQKSFYAFGLRDNEGRLRYFDQEGKALQKQFLKAPLRFSRVSSGFTYRRKHPILGIVRPHLGVDYAAPYGTPVNAAADGKILFAGNKSDYGKLIILSHGGAYQTFYGHLQGFASKIYTGRYVKQGDVIGKVGATGLATGPHLDYRMKKGDRFVNPMTIASPALQSVSDEQHDEFSALRERCILLFEKRFTAHQGCFLVDIAVPDPDKPQVVVLKKNRPVINDAVVRTGS